MGVCNYHIASTIPQKGTITEFMPSPYEFKELSLKIAYVAPFEKVCELAYFILS